MKARTQVLVVDDEADQLETLRLGLIHGTRLSSETSKTTVRIWPGFVAGVQIQRRNTRGGHFNLRRDRS